MKATTQQMELLYVAGYGRSGSTLLDTLLGNHPEAFGAGELTWLFQSALDGHSCSCGAELRHCDFWQAVFQQIFRAAPQHTLASAAEITLKSESLASRRRFRDEYRALWTATFRAISGVSGRRIIVDSSKSSRLAHYRLQLLHQELEFPVKAIHLVRDPRAVMWSTARGSNRRLEAGDKKQPLGGMARGLLSWMYSNTAIELLHWRANGPAVRRIRYEDLASRPQEAFGELGDYLGIRFEDVLRRIDTGDEFQPGHGLAGNRMRRTGQIVLRFDEEWRTKLPSSARRAAWIAWPFLRRYQYA